MGEGAAGGWPTLLARPWLCSCPTEERPRGQGRSGAADNLAASLVSLVRGAQDLLGSSGSAWDGDEAFGAQLELQGQGPASPAAFPSMAGAGTAAGFASVINMVPG